MRAIRLAGAEQRLLFGSDWPFYHIGMSLAKVLLCTESRHRRFARGRILRDNALALFPELTQGYTLAGRFENLLGAEAENFVSG